MKCTTCSREIKPIVAFDIDGTLGDYHGHFALFAEQYLQRRLPRVTNWSSDQEFSEFLEIEKEEYRRIKLAYRQGGLKRSMPLYQGMIDRVQQARADGCEVWLTTTRPWMSHNNLHPDTRFWLDRAGLEFDSLLYDEDKYRVLAEATDPDRVILIVDDLPEQWRAAARIFGDGVPVIAATTYNRWFHRGAVIPLACNAAMLSPVISDRVARWHKGHRYIHV
jgi:hypothetical protein